MREVKILMVVAMLMVGLLAACSGNSEQTDGSESNTNNDSDSNTQQENTTNNDKETVEISWVTNPVSSQELENFYNQLIKDFEAENPGIKVKWSQLKESKLQMKQQLVAGAGPDVISASPAQYKELAKAGYLVNLDPYAEKYNWDERYYEWATELFTSDGKQMGVPSLIEGLLVYYNKDMFEENGWEVPKTYEDVKQLSKEMQEKDIIPFAFGTSDYKAANEWWISAVVNGALSRDELKKYLTGNKSWTSPSMKDSINKLKFMWQEGYINDKKSFSISIDDAWNLFYSSRAAMKMEGTWGTKSLMENNPDFKWGTFLIPAFSDDQKPTIPIGISSGFGINAKSEHPDETAAFLDFMHSKAKIKEQLKFGDYYPIKGIDVASVEGVKPKIVETYEVIQESFESDSAGYVSWTYWPPSVVTHLWGEFDSLVLDQISTDRYLKGVQEEAEKDKEEGVLILTD